MGGLHPDLQAKEQALAVTYSNHNRAEGTFVPSLIAVETGITSWRARRRVPKA